MQANIESLCLYFLYLSKSVKQISFHLVSSPLIKPLLGHSCSLQHFLRFFRTILKQRWHNIFIISTSVRKLIPPTLEFRSNLCRADFLDADLGSFSSGNASVPLQPSASKMCLQCDHDAWTSSFYQCLEGLIVTGPVLQIKNSCISNDSLICKIF